ncbi:SDR family oxidoreductase [Rufibacter sediminis]|uniref:SDR family oxidoreductase n=1 Tax=Rufibacter sediminis TaxID=2762756 RepID=A0ABR6VWB7_9BACT|nr:SDR family oxidoreductase [Rufibacter sediminis]MBC3540906.1 SDR family oxidoreductase [Rufibacter sediminis]
MKQRKTALVAGGNGIIGRNLTEYLTQKDDWEVIVTSRTPLNFDTPAKFVALDLLDPNAVQAQAEALKAVTHVFFASYIENKTLADQTRVNLALIENLVNGIEQVAPDFEHVTFIQGGKAYGAHLGIYKTPAKETDLRTFPPNFYFSQEDFLRTASQGKKWSWTALRPDIVIGFTIGNPMNLSNLIAVYASLCKELGVPMRFPGPPKAYKVVVNVTGVDVLSKSMEWAAVSENTREEIFNITNGDVFRWEQAWKKFGEFFGVEIDEPQTFSLQEYMADKGPLWDEMVQKYGLAPHPLDKLVQWGFGDFIFNTVYDAFMDVNKARRFGFHEMHIDSIDHMLHTFQQLRDNKIIP